MLFIVGNGFTMQMEVFSKAEKGLKGCLRELCKASNSLWN